MSYPIQVAMPVRNGKRIYKQAPVRRETNDERLSRRYGNGIINVGDYDGMHVGPPTNYYPTVTRVIGALK